jgi:hypothetical protein
MGKVNITVVICPLGVKGYQGQLHRVIETPAQQENLLAL